MHEHYHASIENIMVYGISAILVINLTRIAASWAAKSNNMMLSSFGKSAGALVSFGS